MKGVRLQAPNCTGEAVGVQPFAKDRLVVNTSYHPVTETL
jgi:hypothetical protein